MTTDALDIASFSVFTPIQCPPRPLPVLDMSITYTETNTTPVIVVSPEQPILDMTITYEYDIYRL